MCETSWLHFDSPGSSRASAHLKPHLILRTQHPLKTVRRRGWRAQFSLVGLGLRVVPQGLGEKIQSHLYRRWAAVWHLRATGASADPAE